jgi:hypothetical protein
MSQPGPGQLARPYCVRGPASGSGPVEAWAGYPLQFGGQRRFGWQDQMAADLHAALAGLKIPQAGVLAGEYLSTDTSRCDTENRLFTNPGPSCFPKRVSAIRFERGIGPPPSPPAPVVRAMGHLYYYRYQVGGEWHWWEPATGLARWHRVPRHLADDGSARPVWLAMRRAAAAGQIEMLGHTLQAGAPFGIQITVHATSRGPYQATAISECMIDGTIAAFHQAVSPAAAATARAALALRMPSVDGAELEALAAGSSPGALFPGSALVIKGSNIQINPSDERCIAGQVTIRPDAQGPVPQLSGELFTVRPAAPTQQPGKPPDSTIHHPGGQ